MFRSRATDALDLVGIGKIDNGVFPWTNQENRSRWYVALSLPLPREPIFVVFVERLMVLGLHSPHNSVRLGLDCVHHVVPVAEVHKFIRVRSSPIYKHIWESIGTDGGNSTPTSLVYDIADTLPLFPRLI